MGVTHESPADHGPREPGRGSWRSWAGGSRQVITLLGVWYEVGPAVRRPGFDPDPPIALPALTPPGVPAKVPPHVATSGDGTANRLIDIF
jgi:hypothetical protein